MKNVVITGGSGFVGGYLLSRLLNDEEIGKIYNLDLLPSGFKNEKLIEIQCDIRDASALPNLSRIDTIYHMAALCKEPGYHWDEYFDTNLRGTQNILELCDNSQASTLIFISTMMVFKGGNIARHVNDVTNPDTAYGISKCLAEEKCISWANSSKKTLKIIRPGVIFGKNENGNYDLMKKSIEKGIFVFMGRKDTIKGSIYVEDCVNLIINAQNMKGIKFHCVYPEKLTISGITSTIAEVFELGLKTITIPYRLAYLIGITGTLLSHLGVKTPVHHRKIEKLYYDTNLICSEEIVSAKIFATDFRGAIKRWKASLDEQ